MLEVSKKAIITAEGYSLVENIYYESTGDIAFIYLDIESDDENYFKITVHNNSFEYFQYESQKIKLYLPTMSETEIVTETTINEKISYITGLLDILTNLNIFVKQVFAYINSGAWKNSLPNRIADFYKEFENAL